MRKALPWLLLAASLPAATLRGTVVENLTGHPLAHTSVLLEPVPGSGGVRVTGRTNRYGLFEFTTKPGIYILQATRPPFLTAYYGQKRWNSAGMPLTITDSDSQFVTIRMMRYGAINGTVVDENDVGQTGFAVAAYKNTRPLQLAANAIADERGVYRIYGLLPGDYIVRSLGKDLEGVGYKPTFARETDEPDQAHQVDVDIEEEERGVKLRPLPGQLFKLTVTATPTDPGDPPPPVIMTLVSDMSRQVIKSGSHTFSGLPAGDYEIFAEAPSYSPDQKQAAYERIHLAKDNSVSLILRRIPPVTFQFEGLPTQALNDGTVKLLGRRKDLAGSHDTQVIPLSDHRATLAVGPWEFAVAPIEGYYVARFSGVGSYRPQDKSFDGWNADLVIYGGSVRFSMSSSASSLHGTVSDGGDPVAGAPVFLEPMDIDPARRLTDNYVTITDVHGQYHFGSLGPGKYRVLSSFEYQMPDSKTMENAHAKELQIDVHTDTGADLDLYVIR
ncbi:MAG TPA: carboxypeptidase-like regulatory domain-containing protein [Bryobacteraceae bacterium]|nr:carboxypeptidase-like regulatory domain-containing protein [Bryobacteraceae bacterium]